MCRSFKSLKAGTSFVALPKRYFLTRRSALCTPFFGLSPVPVSETARIQEAHITIIHILCDLVEAEVTRDAQ